MKKIFIVPFLLAVCFYARSQNLITRCEYWIDNNYSTRVQLSVTPSASYTFNSAIDYSGLSDGVHIFNIRFMQSDGKWSHTLTSLFMKVPVSAGDYSITESEYWFDNAYASRVRQSVTPSSTYSFISGIDCNSLSQGVHLFHIRFRQSNGSWSSVLSQLFYRPPTASGVDNNVTAYEYWMDNAYSDRIYQGVAPADNYSFLSSINCSSLSTGAHIFNLRFRQTDGKWSSTMSQLFFKIPPPPATDNSIVSYEYWIDNNYAARINQPVTPSSAYSFISGIDYNSLSFGVHTFNIRFRQTDGKWSSLLSQMFSKPPPTTTSPGSITRYEYWFNDGFTGRTAINTPGQGSYTTNASYSIDTMSRFINQFHGRYLDNHGYCTYFDQQFYSINQEVMLYLQGLYEEGLGGMRKAQNESGDIFPGTIADTISLEIRESVSPYKLMLRFHGVELHTNGSCHVTDAGLDPVNTPTASNNKYFIGVRHRNSILTSSKATPLNASVPFNFTGAASQAFGSNQEEVDGVFVIFGGDVNQDEIVDSGDMIPIDNLSSNFISGYLPEDANGDGLIDSGDMIIVDNNSSEFINAIIPW